MIMRRASENIRSENWFGVAIEFALVVLGVFFGIVAANWNEERLQKRETAELLEQVRDELTTFVAYIRGVRRYYASAGGYADRATAAWDGSLKLSDNDFVIAAYQASQITGIGNNADVWSIVFGAEQLRDIEDKDVRNSLAQVMTFDYALVDLNSVTSRYREEVRKLIPNELQDQIRTHCGDRRQGPAELGWYLPPTCALQLDPESAAQTAAALRGRKDLVRELHWHRAAVANQLAQAENLEEPAALLVRKIGG